MRLGAVFWVHITLLQLGEMVLSYFGDNDIPLLWSGRKTYLLATDITLRWSARHCKHFVDFPRTSNAIRLFCLRNGVDRILAFC